MSGVSIEEGRARPTAIGQRSRPRPRATPPRPELDPHLDAARSGQASSLDALSSATHLSRFHLSRTIRDYLGFPLRDFVTASRVDRGIDALIAGHDVTRSQVEAGFDSPSSYHHAFVRHTGLAPSAFRAQMRELARFVQGIQAEDPEMVLVRRCFTPTEHPQAHGLRLRVDGAEPGSALFLALHPEPLVKREPLLGIALLGRRDYEVRAIPDGRYWAMVVEVPRADSLGSYFHMGGNRRQMASEPVIFPLKEPASLSLSLRDQLASDPPITLNLPWLLLDGLRGRGTVEVSNLRQAPAPGCP